MKKFLTEFKEFAVRGNVIDMAVGIVIGGAFSKIVTALVNMVMSVVGLFTSAVNLSELAVTLQRAGEEAPYFSLPYGAFLQSVLEFIILPSSGPPAAEEAGSALKYPTSSVLELAITRLPTGRMIWQ